MNTNYFWLTLPASVMLFGGVLTTFWHPSKALISLIQHLSVGIILAVLTLEVFPEMRSANIAPITLISSFTLGTLFMYCIKILGDYLETDKVTELTGQAFNFGFIITVFIDAALDGITIGAGFAAGEKVGFALALGLSVEMLFLGMSLISDTIKGVRALQISAGLSFTILVSALLGYYLLSNTSSDIVSMALAFSAAALLYLVTEELLIEAHRYEEKPYSMLVLFSGFIVFWLISLL